MHTRSICCSWFWCSDFLLWCNSLNALTVPLIVIISVQWSICPVGGTLSELFTIGKSWRMWKLCLIPTLLPDGDGCTVCVLCLWCNRALSHFYRQWLLCSVEEFYGTRRIWPLCMSHYVPHHGRNAGSQHHFFLKLHKWAVTNWSNKSETGYTNHQLPVTTVCWRSFKKREKNHTSTRGSQTCIFVLCSCCLCCQSNSAVLFYKYPVSPPAPANDVNDVSSPKTADDHVRQWQS